MTMDPAETSPVAVPDHQVIELRLTDIHDLFEMSATDLFSEYRNFLTGVDYCISELRSRRSSKPVLLDIRLPPDRIEDDLVPRVQATLRRYCIHRMRYNQRERSALRLDGVTALRIGLPITAIGLLMTVWASHIDENEALEVVIDHLGWVLAWIGLWFPLDTLLFYGHPYARETRVLRLLHDAEVVIRPRSTTMLDRD
jgi:hypothetical protein